MLNKTCFLIGHHDAPESVCPQLDAAIDTHIVEYGVAEFIVGHYGAFDRFATHVLAEAKRRHPMVTLRLLIPYHPRHVSQRYRPASAVLRRGERACQHSAAPS